MANSAQNDPLALPQLLLDLPGIALLGLGVLIGKDGSGSLILNIAAFPAEPTAEMSPIPLNVTAANDDCDDCDDISDINGFVWS